MAEVNESDPYYPYLDPFIIGYSFNMRLGSACHFSNKY